MDEEQKKAYVAEASARLKREIGAKLGEIRALVSAEAKNMVECGGADAAESVLCALDCTCDQVAAALDSWERPA